MAALTMEWEHSQAQWSAAAPTRALLRWKLPRAERQRLQLEKQHYLTAVQSEQLLRWEVWGDQLQAALAADAPLAAVMLTQQQLLRLAARLCASLPAVVQLVQRERAQ